MAHFPLFVISFIFKMQGGGTVFEVMKMGHEDPMGALVVFPVKEPFQAGKLL